MKKVSFFLCTAIICLCLGLPALTAAGGYGEEYDGMVLPRPTEEYVAQEAELGIDTLSGVLMHRIQEDPFNLVASVIFLVAILHTFASGSLRKLAHRLEHEHEQAVIAKRKAAGDDRPFNAKEDTAFWPTVVHFLGEVEAIFGIYCFPLIIGMFLTYDWHTVTHYFDTSVNYTEPMFVVVIMAMASTRPILKFAELVLGKVAGIGNKSPAAWWLSILMIAPLLGSFITEPAAMTIAALLLAQQFYRHQPSSRFMYATLGLLFVNVSVGGTLTHFAAPPVLMVAAKFDFHMLFMLEHFGIKAVIGILASTLFYYVVFRKEFKIIGERARALETKSKGEEPVPFWVTGGILLFMAWTVFTLHHPALFIGGFLVFLAFVAATRTHQDDVSIKGPLLVGFFLAGLVTHGKLQGWWIAPILGRLGEVQLFIGSTVLTAFNDNAAITYLASLVPAFDHRAMLTEEAVAIAKGLQYAVVAGAVTGGGLTVIANAPNPAGQSILQRFFGKGGISPMGLLFGALVPTVIMAIAFHLW